MDRDFKGVWIPKAVWLDERLNALDKVILTEIDSLDSSERGCYASNKHIAEFCQCSETKVSTSISQLIKYGYVRVQKFDGRQRELKSCLSKFESLPFKKCESAFQNLKESNIDNNTVNNTVNKESVREKPQRQRFVKPTREEVDAYCREKGYNIDSEHFIDYYESKGWVVGKVPMKDWKATIRNWVRRDKEKGERPWLEQQNQNGIPNLGCDF